MKTTRLIPLPLAGLLALVATLATPKLANAQVTNWVAYNDHRPTTAPVVNGWRITGPNVTGFDMGAPADTPASVLKDFRTGAPLAATVSFSRTGTPDDFGGVGRPIPTNTPMAQLFYGVCDLSNDGVIGVRSVPLNTAESYVTVTFNGLNPAKHYVFRGSGVRNGSYARRWTVATILANSSVDAHINGTGSSRVLTADTFPASGLAPGQAAWNSGANPEGAVIGWDFVSPFPDGTFSITCKQYTGAIPLGGNAGSPTDLYGYSFGALLLAEVEVAPPVITSNPIALTSVEQNRPFSLSVAATGTPLLYQWYKQGVGAVSGATFPTFSVAQAALGDSGNYYAVVYNPLARATSMVAQVTVFADTNAPTVESIFTYPTVDAGGVATLDQIIIEFNEPVTSASVSSPAQYTVPGGGNPASVIVTNNRSVVLMLASPLTADTDYSVTLSGATDVLGNVAGSSSAPFHSWVPGGGNGLLFEAFNVEGISPEVFSLTDSPNYPDNPFTRATLGIFDSRAAFPDDTHNQYGGRIRGVFIPPVSGDWVFFFRTRQRGVVYLNPNGTDAAGKVEILRESTGNTPLNWDRFTSPPQSLRAGRGYYVESLYKEGDGGADFVKVAARLVGTGFPTPVDTPDIQVDPNSLSGAFIAYPLAPRGLGGALTIAQDVGDVTAEENHPATFSLVLNNPSGLPLFYQWFRDGAQIAGANGPTYTLEATSGDNNAMFSVTGYKIGAQVTSRSAKLTVVPDVTGPNVVEAISPDLTNTIVRFSERVDSMSAQDTFGYGLSGPSGDIVILAATLEADRSTVTLTNDAPLVAGETYQLSVSGVVDLNSLVIDPNPNVVTFIAGTTAPRLSIRLSGNTAVLSWPASATGYVVEYTDAFTIPVTSTVWIPMVATPRVINGRNEVDLLSVSSGPGARLFRLRK